MSWLSDLEAQFAVDEQWVVTQINKAWAEVQKVESWVDTELTTISGWIAAHLQDLTALGSVAAALVPMAGPEIAAAETALAAAGAAATALANNLKAGSTPASTVSNAYTAVKAAQTAVNAVLSAAAAKPN